MTRPRASISLDLDNLWSYLKIHGDAGWESHPSYLDELAPIVIERLRRHGLRLSIFVVGQDAALAKNEGALRALAAEGHEIGNHSFSHEPWFHEYDRAQVTREIADAESHIERVTGQRPRGFRGPGFSLSPDVLAVLVERGYLYDASTFPTFLGPLARAYYFMTARGLTAEEREKRKRLYGTAAEGRRPIRPYRWQLPGGRLLEIPVTTMPIARVPIHLSYLIYLASFSETASRAYLETALALCRASRVEPSFLLHPLDFLGGDRIGALAFFPGMKLPTARKLAIFDDVIGRLRRRFDLVPLEEHARSLLAGPLPTHAFA